MTLNPALQNSGFWTSADPQGYSTSVQFLASGGTPGVLEPGETETVPVYYAGWLNTQWDFTDAHLNFTLGVINGANTIAVGWNTAGMEASLQPPGMPANAWAAIYSNLTTQIGPTWGDYVQRLDQDASFLGSLGEMSLISAGSGRSRSSKPTDSIPLIGPVHRDRHDRAGAGLAAIA